MPRTDPHHPSQNDRQTGIDAVPSNVEQRPPLATNPRPFHSSADREAQERTPSPNVQPANENASVSESLLPPAIVDESDSHGRPLIRRAVIASKLKLQEQRAIASRQAGGLKYGAEKNSLHKHVQDCYADEQALESRLEDDFIPGHGPNQFLSPRSFFQTQLFGAGNHAIQRIHHVEIVVAEKNEKPIITYRGPELRQSDAKVFLALLHMLRDVQVGTQVHLEPEPVCKALFGRYDGHSRKQLREHIQRLQTGLIITEKCSIQLCQAFEHPNAGLWSVALHSNIVELFRLSQRVWLSLPMRLSLPDGLTSWLYAYIESQSRLIPTNVSTLLEKCGSTSKPGGFLNSLRRSLRELANRGIIEPGWSIRKGLVRWMKKVGGPSGLTQ